MPKVKKVFPILGIYKITSPTNKIYIGKSTDIKKRWNSYKNLRCKQQKIIYNSLSKYGYENHKFEIIHTLPLNTTQQELSELEIFYINKYLTDGWYMMNLQFADNVIMQPIDDIDILKERDDDILYTIMNVNDSSKVETSNLLRFCKEYKIHHGLNKNLLSTLYGYDETGRKIQNCRGWKITSHKSLISNEYNRELQLNLANEIFKRKYIHDNLKRITTKRIGHSEIYQYEILNTSTKEILYTNNLTKFCIDNNLNYLKSLRNTLYGLTRDGKYAKEYKNFKIISKKYINKNKNNDELYQLIQEEIQHRVNKRKEVGRNDKKSPENFIRMSMNSRKFIYTILDIANKTTTETTDIFGFMKITIGNKSSAILHTLYGYSYSGDEYTQYKGFKIISKHYINKDLDDEKLQQEIKQEIIRRKSIKNK